MGIFEYLDYREFLTDECRKRRKHQPGFTQARLAEASRIGNTYFTNFLKGRANLNSDQVFALARELALSGEETHYLMLLKESDQCTLADRKKALRAEVDALRARALKTESHISAQVRRDEHELILTYYGDPWNKVVHLMLQIPRYANDPARIAGDLNLRPAQLNGVLKVLKDLGIIDWGEKRIEVVQKNFHLPKESPMLQPHQTLMRMKSATRLLELPPELRRERLREP